MKNYDWIEHHKRLATKGLCSAHHNGFEFEASTEAYRGIIRATIKDHCDGEILDVCCGSGDVTAPLVKEHHVTGIEAVARSCELAAEQGLEVKNICIQHFETTHSFDIVVCVEAITLLDDPGDILRLYNRVRRSDSRLLISFVNRGSLLRKVYNFVFKKNANDRNVDKYSFWDISELGSEFSLSVIDYRPVLQYIIGAVCLPKFIPKFISVSLSTHVIMVFSDDK